MKTLFLLLLTTLLFSTEITVEILGSGGPEIDGRASASYLIWIDKEAKVLIDTGSGAMLRFEQSSAKLETLARDTDLFIAHHAIAEDAGAYAKNLHMTPSMIADIASKANVKKVVLSHRMHRTRDHENESLKIIHRSYHGEVLFAEDRLKITF